MPEPAEVFAPDGVTVLINQAMLAPLGGNSSIQAEQVIGKYNIFRILPSSAWGKYPAEKRFLKAEMRNIL
jgi:hypothetical protein